jgi:LmbE family N-acetylglucosaminyl deacetylase
MKILAAGPHPDDIEFGCAPLLIQEVQKGHTVRLAITTLGEASTAGTPEERELEARAAAAEIGAEIEFLDMGGDCHIEPTTRNCIVMARLIREFQPQILLAPTPDENQHPDHIALSRIVQRAARLARYGGLKELRGLRSHRIDNLYFYAITASMNHRPDILVDVTTVHAQWEAAMRCHKTQVANKGYMDLVNSRARTLGASIGVEYAMALWLNDPVRLDAISDLRLSSRNF